MTTQWRALSAEEIDRLTQQGCTCTDWSKVQVAEGFRTDRVRTTHFGGEVRLGVFEKEVSFFGDVTKPTGISHATIHNCTIGDNVYISTVRNYIANYVIEDDVVIDNIDLLAVEGESSFGNGTKVAVVNEAGGREVPIYDHLSAQTAYVLAFYQHRPKVIEKLRALIDGYTASVRSPMGFVGKGARIINSRLLKNIRIGPAATIEGVNRLENGSINSCVEDPVYIGPGVYAEDFIVASGSTDHRRHDHLPLLHRPGLRPGQAVLRREFRLLRQLRRLPRRGLLHLRRAVHRHAPQVHAPDRGPVLLPQRRQRHQPEQPHVQARAGPPGRRRAGLQDRQRLLHALARQGRGVHRGHGPALPQLRHLGPALLLPDRARGRERAGPGRQPAERRDRPRRPQVAQARPPQGPEEARPHQFQAAEPLHDPEDDQRPGPAAQAQGHHRPDLRLFHLPQRQDPRPCPGARASSSIRSASTSSSATASSSGWRTGVSRTSRSCGPFCKPDTQVGPGKWIDLAGMFAPEEDGQATADRYRERRGRLPGRAGCPLRRHARELPALRVGLGGGRAAKSS